MYLSQKYLIYLLLLVVALNISAQDTIRYTGETLSNIDYHHGQLRSAVGVHNIQVARANRDPKKSDGFGWTYNHAPMLVYWNDTFYLQYLSNPVGEHIPAGQSFMVTSKDGVNWTKPATMFPIYSIPDGTTKENHEGVAKDLDAIMHQRMGFYVAENGCLLALAYYGIALDKKDKPNDGHGIGRVVREVNKDGSLGDIHFIRYNHAWNETNTPYPFYKSSKNKKFVKACDELLADPLMMQQWVEEADRDDELIPLKASEGAYKAFSYYHLPDNRVVGLWKHALTSISEDGGRSWQYKPCRAPGFVNSNAKIWGQKTADGRYATVYNPSEFRWPLAVSVSEDGLNYENLLLVHGEISAMRYGGNYKSYGPQYVRGILEGNGNPKGDDMWVSYSVNKEDIWVSKVPLPVTDQVENAFDDHFSEMNDEHELQMWNIYSPLWATAKIKTVEDGKVLSLSDKDPFDYAKAERVFPAAKRGVVIFEITPNQNDTGMLQVELQSGNNSPSCRLIWDADGKIKFKDGYRVKDLMAYEKGVKQTVKLRFDTELRMYWIQFDDLSEKKRVMFAPASKLEKIVFRTGEVRRFPHSDTPTDQDYDLDGANDEDPLAVFDIHRVKFEF